MEEIAKLLGIGISRVFKRIKEKAYIFEISIGRFLYL